MAQTAAVEPAPQHLRALERANQVRLARADLKRRIASRETTVAQVVGTPPWEACRMTVSELLMSQKRWGRARTKRLLVSIGLPENKEVGTLTDRQRVVLAAVLHRRGPTGSDAR
jgi:hypothetical protein